VKSIPIKECVKVKIYAEFLNAFNCTNWNVIDGFAGGTNNPAEYANISNSTFPALSCLESWCREGESNPQDPKVGGF
jgi:hypothetical protein